jgi:hypothetical protein
MFWAWLVQGSGWIGLGRERDISCGTASAKGFRAGFIYSIDRIQKFVEMSFKKNGVGQGLRFFPTTGSTGLRFRVVSHRVVRHVDKP